MDIDDDKKISILTNMINERYKAEHNMRDRSKNFTTWILGLGVALLWILINKPYLEISLKVGASLLVSVYLICSLWFLHEICKGFKSNRRIMITLEDALHLYDKGYYISNESILPEVYKNPYNKGTPSHFMSLYGLLIVFTVFLLILIFSKPSNKPPLPKVCDQVQVGFDQVYYENR